MPLKSRYLEMLGRRTQIWADLLRWAGLPGEPTVSRRLLVHTFKWTEPLLPLPLITEVGPVSLRLGHSEASILNKALSHREGLFDQAQAPCGQGPPLDSVCSKKSRCDCTQETGGVRVGHSAGLHSNRHQWQQLLRVRISLEMFWEI